MPDTPIDLSEGIQSVRLKVPTAEVPIPPEGFAQLHSPAPGELALRLPDGSVVGVGGGGGGGGGDTITGDGGSVSTDATPGHDPGVVLSPALGKTIWLNGPVVGPGENEPFGAIGQPVTPLAAPPPDPPEGTVVAWLDLDGVWHTTYPGGGEAFSAQGAPGTTFGMGSVGVFLVSAGQLVLQSAGNLTLTNGGVQLNFVGDTLTLNAESGVLRASGLPTVDPVVSGVLWVDPVTRVLKVSAG